MGSSSTIQPHINPALSSPTSNPKTWANVGILAFSALAMIGLLFVAGALQSPSDLGASNLYQAAQSLGKAFGTTAIAASIWVTTVGFAGVVGCVGLKLWIPKKLPIPIDPPDTTETDGSSPSKNPPTVVAVPVDAEKNPSPAHGEVDRKPAPPSGSPQPPGGASAATQDEHSSGDEVSRDSSPANSPHATPPSHPEGSPMPPPTSLAPTTESAPAEAHAISLPSVERAAVDLDNSLLVEGSGIIVDQPPALGSIGSLQASSPKSANGALQLVPPTVVPALSPNASSIAPPVGSPPSVHVSIGLPSRAPAASAATVPALPSFGSPAI